MQEGWQLEACVMGHLVFHVGVVDSGNDRLVILVPVMVLCCAIMVYLSMCTCVAYTNKFGTMGVLRN
eukprot:3408832-Lingulodinium_polyedra.AAC.1